MKPTTTSAFSYRPTCCDALSQEWQIRVEYTVGDRVACKVSQSPGVAAFECLQERKSSPSTVGQKDTLRHRISDYSTVANRVSSTVVIAVTSTNFASRSLMKMGITSGRLSLRDSPCRVNVPAACFHILSFSRGLCQNFYY